MSLFVSSSSTSLSKRTDAAFLPIVASAALGGCMVWLWQRHQQRQQRHGSQRSYHINMSKGDKSKIYLDYNGTTPIYPQVMEAMIPYLTDEFGNPSSTHWAGVQPRRAVETARGQVLQLLSSSSASSTRAPHDNQKGAHTTESIWFTSCGTESDNLAIQLALQSARKEAATGTTPPHIVTSNIEHPAVANYLDKLERLGHCRVTYVPVQQTGQVNAQEMIAAIESNDHGINTVLVSLMLANNETGALQPVTEVARYCRMKGILFHTDAAQAAGKVSVALQELGDPDMVTLVGHKIGAPKGIACLYVRPGCLSEHGRLLPPGGVVLVGGGQEHGRRGGTENVPHIVALGKAAEIAAREWPTAAKHMEAMRSRLLWKLSQNGVGRDLDIMVNGPSHPSLRLPNTLSVGFRNINSSLLLQKIGHQVAASAGATCHATTGSASISSVLLAMKVPLEFARGTIRLSIGPTTSEDEIDQAARIINDALQEEARRRAMSGL